MGGLAAQPVVEGGLLRVVRVSGQAHGRDGDGRLDIGGLTIVGTSTSRVDDVVDIQLDLSAFLRTQDHRPQHAVCK